MSEANAVLELLAEGRLIRHSWTGTDAQGRATACLLAALAPEAGAAEDAAACPSAVMPSWLAHLTVFIDDRGTLKHWPSHVRRYAAVVHKFTALAADGARSRRADYACRAVAIRAVRKYAGSSFMVVDQALALCEREARGDVVDAAAWKAAREWAAAAWVAAAAAATAEAAAADHIIDGVLAVLETA